MNNQKRRRMAAFLRFSAVFVLALLVGNAAAGLAGALAGGLAFAAAAVRGACAQIARFQGHNVLRFHVFILHKMITAFIPCFLSFVKRFYACVL
jgi:hypothetical protein